MDSSADDCLIQEAIRQDPERTSLTACNNGIDILPAYIVRLQRLKRLTMYDNMLSELPPELGELSCLQYLNLRCCPQLNHACQRGSRVLAGSTGSRVCPLKLESLQRSESYIWRETSWLHYPPRCSNISSFISKLLVLRS